MRRQDGCWTADIKVTLIFGPSCQGIEKRSSSGSTSSTRKPSMEKKHTMSFRISWYSEKLAVIIDPPCGAKTELICESLARLKQRAEMLSCSVTISYIWVFLTSWRSRCAGKHPSNMISLQPSPWPGGICFSWAANGWLPGDLLKTQAVQGREGGEGKQCQNFHQYQPQVRSHTTS